MNLNSQCYFLTFANSDYMSTNRIANQANEFNIFDKILQLNENDIKDFIEKHKNFINNNPAGYGNWIWKPKIIYDTLVKLNENDILIYSDAGMYLNINGKDRLKEYLLKLTDDKAILTFCTSETYLSRTYVKMDAVMNYYPEFRNKLDIACYAGLMVIKKCDSSLTLIKEWLNLCENYHFLNKERSTEYKEADYFGGNDSDNGLFNLCLSKHENIVTKISHHETNLFRDEIQIAHCSDIMKNPQSIDWSSLNTFPFQCRRMTPKFGF
jgi:hypothetical protein